ncbi:hypothetical protein [Raoultella terrigena]|uniref:Uncharacterized protein n=1 Tax=Raoultella terrigena TaxID=577 RepID=A0A3P8KF53_RAOTE|nr:hypothetical protein [Raoultella terrigena]VDR27605.1 Uncharacterised protein [Raoultella terrigena]
MNISGGCILAALALCSISFAATAKTTSVKCSYPTYSDQSGNHAAKNPLVFTFIIDSGTNKAYIAGNVGSAEVAIVPNGVDGMSFIETTEVGNVTVTTMTRSGESVHSRNMVMPGGIFASQHYGTCVVQ